MDMTGTYPGLSNTSKEAGRHKKGMGSSTAATTTAATTTAADAVRAQEAEVEAQRLQRQRQQRLAEQTPISLHKVSLRIRLEAYYTLIAPDTLENRREWLNRYDQIYDKYGGTHEGERKLAAKLAKKYGSMVRLKVVEEERNSTNGTTNYESNLQHHDEAWYELRPNEGGSQDVNILSCNFDPLAALMTFSEAEVMQQNRSLLQEATSLRILDNVDKCVALLPDQDPLRARLERGKKGSATTPASAAAGNTARTKRPRPESQLHLFEEIALGVGGKGNGGHGMLGSGDGPHSVLFRLQKKRIQIVVRYVNGIRGTLTGTLVAFDKHMNMLLKNVVEVYSPRRLDRNTNQSNLEMELERRQQMMMMGVAASAKDQNVDTAREETIPSWNVRQRHMKQLLVRGDMVVSVYEALQERQHYSKSRYHSRGETSKGKGMRPEGV